MPLQPKRQEETGLPSKAGIYLKSRHSRMLIELMDKLSMNRSELIGALIEQEHQSQFGKE